MTGDKRVCVLCGNAIDDGGERVSINGVDYHARCYDRSARKCEVSSDSKGCLH